MKHDARLDAPPGVPARALARLAAFLFPLRGERPEPHELRRVLVVRPDDRVGNALLTIPLALALRDALPEARVDLLLARRRACVAEGLPGIRVVPFEKTDAFRHPARFLRFLRQLRAARYDAVIDAAHWHAFSTTSALLSRFAARRWLVGAERGPSFLYSYAEPPPAAGTPEASAKLLLLRGLGVPPPSRLSLQTALGRERAAWASEATRGLARFAAVNPGARKGDHRWPPERFAALVRALREKGVPSLVTWGPGEEQLASLVATEGAAQLAPATDLDQLAALFRRASIVVTNDTGPMHLAVACGAPVLALLHAPQGARFSHPGPRFVGLVAPEVSEAVAAAGRLLDSEGAAFEPARG
ncbi:MAG TPA: glycosyltransferase family 9 protein [Myxococcales bacterium]|nr:glycosyltransferase family 9 protein [Myxococcales bacterium]